MVRAAAKNHPSVAIVTSPARYADVLAAVEEGGFTLQERQALAAEAFVHTATYDVAVAGWMGNVLTDTSAGTGFPAWMGATWDRSAVLRYGENPHQRAALYTDGYALAAGARPGHPAARQGDVLQQLRRRGRRPACGLRLRPSGRGDHQARQPVRHRDGCRRRGGPPQGPRLRPALGVRRRDRHQRAGQQGDGRAGRRDLHRGRRRARLRARRRRGAQRARRTSGCCSARRPSAAGSSCGRSPGASCCRPATPSTPRPTTAGTTRRRGGWSRATPPPTRCSPTSRSPGRRAAR